MSESPWKSHKKSPSNPVKIPSNPIKNTSKSHDHPILNDPWHPNGAAIYGVPWIPSTNTPFMLAYIPYIIHGSVMGDGSLPIHELQFLRMAMKTSTFCFRRLTSTGLRKPPRPAIVIAKGTPLPASASWKSIASEIQMIWYSWDTHDVHGCWWKI